MVGIEKQNNLSGMMVVKIFDMFSTQSKSILVGDALTGFRKRYYKYFSKIIYLKSTNLN